MSNSKKPMVIAAESDGTLMLPDFYLTHAADWQPDTEGKTYVVEIDNRKHYLPRERTTFEQHGNDLAIVGPATLIHDMYELILSGAPDITSCLRSLKDVLEKAKTSLTNIQTQCETDTKTLEVLSWVGTDIANATDSVCRRITTLEAEANERRTEGSNARTN